MANDSTFYNRDKMWFGTTEFMQWIDTPNTGADVSNLSFSADTVLLNGGGYVRNSWDSHKTYQFSWGESASLALAHALNAYRNGSWGRGLIYFHDPMTYGTNILPKRWADPSMAANYEAAPLIPDVFPTTTPAAPGAAGLPVTSANYSLTTGYSSQANNSEHFIPIPPGMTLLLGATYSGTGKLYIRVDGNAPFDLPNLDPAGGVAVNVKVTGQKAYLGIRNTSGAPTSISIQGITARLADTARVPDYMGQPVTNVMPNPGFEDAGSTIDVVTNHYINPNFSTTLGPTVVRTNNIPNPRNIGTPAAGRAPGLNSYSLGSPTGTHSVSGEIQQINVTAMAAGVGTERWGLTYSAITLPAAYAAGSPVTISMDVSAPSLPSTLRARVYMDVQDSTAGNVTRGHWDGFFTSSTGRIVGTATTSGGPVDRAIVYVWIENNNAGAAFSGSATVGFTRVNLEVAPDLPYFDGSTPLVLRTNYLGNPLVITNTSGWAGFTNTTLAYSNADAPPVGGGSVVVTTTAANGGVTWSVTGAPGSNPSPIGTAWCGMWVKGTAGQQIRWNITEYENTTAIGNTSDTTITATGDWQQLEGSYTKISNTSRVRLHAFLPVAGTFLAGGGYISQTQGFFTGSSVKPGFGYGFTAGSNVSPSIEWDADFSSRWKGTTNLSASELTGLGMASLGTGDGVAAIRSSWDYPGKIGTYSLRLVPISTTNNISYALIPFPAALSGGGVAHVIGHQEAPLTGSLWARRGGPYTNPGAFTPGSTNPNANATTVHRFNFPSASASNIVLPHGGLIGSGDVWWNMLFLTPGTYTGPVFSGDTTSTDPDLPYVWTGAANASTSAQRGTMPASVSTVAPDRAARIQSALWSKEGVRSMRVMPNGSTNATYGEVAIPGGTVVGQTYTVLGTVRTIVPLTGVLNPYALGFWVVGASEAPVNYTAQATNAPGVYEVRGTFTATATNHAVRFMNGSQNAGEDVWWDAVGVFSGNYAGPWGSGTFTTPINIDEGQLPWYSGEGHSGVRFVGTPTLVNYNGVNGGQMGLSCNLKEVGAWA